MDIPYVSIVIPVYGVERYIKRCLDSVVNQTLKNIEIIIVNDDTKDNSMEICEAFAKEDDRIKIYNKLNEGLGLTRNYGIERSNGEYIAFLDSDDFVDLDFYEKMYNNAKKNETDACFTNYKIYNKDAQLIEENMRNIPFSGEIIDSKLVLFNMLKVPTELAEKKFIGMSVWRAIYKKKIIKENSLKFVSERQFISEDILFNIDFFSNANKISFIKDTYYYYCENSNSLTHIYREDRFKKNKELYLELIRRTKKIGIFEQVQCGLSNLFIDSVRGCIKNEFYYNSLNAKNNVINILNDEYVNKALKIKTKESLRKNMFDFCMKNKNIIMLKLFSGVRRKLKR